MQINLFLVPFIIISGVLFSLVDTAKSRRNYIILTLLVLILEVTLRSESVGADTHKYAESFLEIQYSDWRDIWNRFIGRYFYGSGDYDIGYVLLMKFGSVFTSNWHVFTFLVQLLFFIPLGLFLNRHAEKMRQLIFAFIFYLALIQVFPLSGGRQVYALGMTMLSLMYIEKKQYKSAVISFVIGLTFHMSSLIFAGAVALGFLGARIQKRVHLFSFLFIPIMFIAGEIVVQNMGWAIGMEKYANYGAKEGGTRAALTLISMMEVLSLLCYIGIKKRNLIQEPLLIKQYAVLPFITALIPLTSVDGALNRVSLYFHIYLMLLVPIAIELLFPKDKRLVYSFAIVVLALLCISQDFTYYFFWQEEQIY